MRSKYPDRLRQKAFGSPDFGVVAEAYVSTNFTHGYSILVNELLTRDLESALPDRMGALPSFFGNSSK